MIAPEIQDRLLKAFPLETWPTTVRGVREGILLAKDVMKGVPLLSTKLAKDINGHIRRLGILYRLDELCRSGDLPFKSEVTPMPRGNWHWLEIVSNNVRAHIVRTDNPDNFPDDTPNRQDQRLVNQMAFDFDAGEKKVIPISKKIQEITPLYAWLMFGVDRYSNTTHVCYGIPSADSQEFLAYANISKSEQFVIKPEAPEAPDPRSLLRFKEHIKEALEAEENLYRDENE